MIVIKGRGDLHLAVLIERMRREGFEMSITPPEIVTRKCPDTGATQEPIERVIIELAP
jgi:GTP-binding protein